MLKYRNKLRVVGLSVDQERGTLGDWVKKSEDSLRKRRQWTWPNMYDPDGFNGVARRFNIGGYGLTLVAPDGNVLAKGIRMEEAESILDRWFANHKPGGIR